MGVHGGPDIVTDGLTHCIDAANAQSYISSSSTVSNMLNITQTGSFVNDVGATNSGGKSAFVFGLDGIDDTIEFNSRFTTSGQTDITISIWFKKDEFIGGFHGLANEIAFNNPKRSRIIVDGAGSTVYYILAGTQRTVSISPAIPNDTWTNLTLTKDSSVGSKLYINSDYKYGNSSDTGTVAGQGGGSFSGAVLGIGAETVYYMDGEISNVMVYNRLLSEGEVLQNYNALKGRFGL